MVGLNNMSLRERKNQPPPPPPPPKVHQPAPVAGTSNLRPGHTSSPGHVWKPSTHGSRASHFGAPGHLPEATQRHPPRPQNHSHYTKQLQATRDAEAKHKAAAGAQKGSAKHSAAQTVNRLSSRSAPQTRPSSPRGHQAPASSPQARNPPHGSTSKGGSSKKK